MVPAAVTRGCLAVLTVCALLGGFRVQVEGGSAEQPATGGAPAYGDTLVRSSIGDIGSLIPNIASDTPNIRRNAAAIVKLMEKRGITARVLVTPGAPPVVYG